MASKHAETQVRVTADTKQFNSKVQESKQNFKDFANVSGQVSSKLGDALGIPTDKINQMAGALRGLGQKLEQTGNTGATAFANVLKSIGPCATAIAGLGVGTAVGAFKLLNAEAEAFKNTIQGANIELATQAYLDTYRQAMRDTRQELGKGTAEIMAEAKKSLGKLGADIAGGFATYIANEFSGENNGILSSIIPGYDIVKAFRQNGSATGTATQAAEEAERIQNDIYAVERKISDEQKVQAALTAAIAENKLIAYDKTKSTREQAEALAEAERLIKLQYQGGGSFSYTDVNGEQVTAQVSGLQTLYNEQARLMRELNALSSSSVEATDAENQATAKALQTTQGMNNALRELQERKTSVRLESEKFAEAQATERAAAEALEKSFLGVQVQILEVKKSLEGIEKLYNSATDTNVKLTRPELSTSAWEDFAQSVDEGFIKQFGDLKIGVGIELDKDKVQDFTSQLNSLISSSVTTMGTMLGELFGNLATGGDAWGNFKSAALSAMGDLAISLGKLSIEAGLASEGIKAALHLDNPYIAIAAGVALVALGTAIKTGLSNISNGNYSSTSATSSVASSSYSSSSANDWAESEVNVKVTGTLQANGSALVAVLNQEEKRKSHTT